MHPRGSVGLPGRRPARALAARAIALTAAAVVAAAGCASSHAAGPGSAGGHGYVSSCGTMRTAANVPVRVEVAKGHVTCGTAKAVELAYAEAIRSGKAPGNGGGGPVQVRGWTCQGFATPIVLHTGKASKCTRGGSEILEILPPPPSPSASS